DFQQSRACADRGNGSCDFGVRGKRSSSLTSVLRPARHRAARWPRRSRRQYLDFEKADAGRGNRIDGRRYKRRQGSTRNLGGEIELRTQGGAAAGLQLRKLRRQ